MFSFYWTSIQSYYSFNDKFLMMNFFFHFILCVQMCILGLYRASPALFMLFFFPYVMPNTDLKLDDLNE